MTTGENAQLELDDIQSGVLRPRPTPYAATYIVLRIDDCNAGRELMRRVNTVVTSAADPTSPLADTWVSVALTYPHRNRAIIGRHTTEGVPSNQHGVCAKVRGAQRRDNTCRSSANHEYVYHLPPSPRSALRYPDPPASAALAALA